VSGTFFAFLHPKKVLDTFFSFTFFSFFFPQHEVGLT